MHEVVYGTHLAHQDISELHGILRMGSFLLVNVSMEALYLHRCQVYEQRLVDLLLHLQELLYTLRTALLLLEDCHAHV